MAAPAFAAAFAHTGNPTTAPSVTLGTTAANDILIATVVNGGAITVPTLAGTYSGGAWGSAIDSGSWTTGAGAVYWSRCTGNHTGQTVTASTTDSGSLNVVRITGCITSGSPVDTNISGASVAALNGTLSAFTTTVADTLVCLTVAYDDNIVWSGQTMNAVAMNERSEVTSSGGADSMVGFADLAQAVAGTTGSFAITQAGSGQGKRLSAFALKPIPSTTLERASGLNASASIATSGVRVVERSTALAATASLATAGVFWTTFERVSAVSATASIATVAQRDLHRASGVAATTAITTAGEIEAGAATVERSSSLTATASIATAGLFWSTLTGASTLSATATITTDSERDIQRASSLTATAGISTAGEVDGGGVTHERSTSLTATASVSTTGMRVLQRFSSLSAAATIASTGLRDLLRSSSLLATSTIATTGSTVAAVESVGEIEAGGGLGPSAEGGSAAAGEESPEPAFAALESSSGVRALIE